METKKQIKYFTIFNHEKEESYLREMHKKGWKFVKVSGLGVYHFESCEPEDVVYQFDYNPQSGEGRAEYLQMFSDCGWEHIQDYVGYSYFRKPASEMSGEENIFSDTESKTAMMERVYKGRLLPLLVLFCTVFIPQFILNMVNGHYMIASFFGGILLVYVIIFLYVAANYNKNKKK